MKLENEVAIITGGASGIGGETARWFALNGARAVVIADVQDEKGERVAESIGLDRCHFIKCNVSDEEQVKSLIDSTIKLYGQLDIMFSNAGVISPCKQDILDFDFDAYDCIFAINVRGMIGCVKHAGKAMVDGGIKGSIICTVSIMATKGSNFSIDYAMSKHAVLGLVRCASKGLGAHGIRANCVSPGPTPTTLVESMGISLKDFESMFRLRIFQRLRIFLMPIMSHSSMGISLKAENISKAVIFLASDDSEFVTGLNLVVDGGYTPPGKI